MLKHSKSWPVSTVFEWWCHSITRHWNGWYSMNPTFITSRLWMITVPVLPCPACCCCPSCLWGLRPTPWGRSRPDEGKAGGPKTYGSFHGAWGQTSCILFFVCQIQWGYELRSCPVFKRRGIIAQHNSISHLYLIYNRWNFLLVSITYSIQNKCPHKLY